MGKAAREIISFEIMDIGTLISEILDDGQVEELPRGISDEERGVTFCLHSKASKMSYS